MVTRPLDKPNKTKDLKDFLDGRYITIKKTQNLGKSESLTEKIIPALITKLKQQRDQGQ